ncbi:MAG: TIGR00270 family protein [Marine Group II euryarchaeote MED-G36]|nr:MAG: TIGR00270 family protein [Marine Group II euryarchaeote MED-G36]
MGTCELCGADKVGTFRTKASGARVDACSRCIDRLGLEKPTPKPSEIRTKSLVAKSNIRRSSSILTKPDKELAPDFHIRIRNARKDKGWDQREFARRMNERLNIVQRTENGNRPTDNLIKKIEKVLSIELFIEIEADNTRQAGTSTSRSMTIGDVYDDLLRRSE